MYNILKSLKDDRLYIGFTSNLAKRLKEHNDGKNESTKNRMSFILVYYEAHLTKEIAIAREKFLKTGWGNNYIRSKLKLYKK